jgi:nicotinamide-nucleotide amidase
VRLRVTVQGSDPDAAEKRLHDIETKIRGVAGKHVFGTGDGELEEVVGGLLIGKNLTIALAESCTGGLVADLITDVSGSSGYFQGGVVAYSNRSKVELLGVPPELIDKHGAVSKEVALAMADGVRRVYGTSIGLSTTGIAGPTGATESKPVGLVWIAYADANGSVAVMLNLGNDRRRVKERAAAAALELVRRKVMKME